ncbi:uncharacterized protein EI90DRAFT_3129646 [Cantharellus anzutake]|uniref:uncharacterized protein n=1 Tax=Cantharellus anzutake TaxID=1750568 RepID=UPI0019081479|nr:uncharacterized protein EI90DRAFT_3129646 [Cantharellus anzutake]KAF8324681.1 hypothetical protein EI90DRAFT_3129646 [Cantharellus anzutake]
MPSLHLDSKGENCMGLRESEPGTVLCVACYKDKKGKLDDYDFDLCWGKPFELRVAADDGDEPTVVIDGGLQTSMQPHGSWTPSSTDRSAGTSKSGPSALEINASLQLSKSNASAAVPIQVEKCLWELKGRDGNNIRRDITSGSGSMACFAPRGTFGAHLSNEG